MKSVAPPLPVPVRVAGFTAPCDARPPLRQQGRVEPTVADYEGNIAYNREIGAQCDRLEAASEDVLGDMGCASGALQHRLGDFKTRMDRANDRFTLCFGGAMMGATGAALLSGPLAVAAGAVAAVALGASLVAWCRRPDRAEQKQAAADTEQVQQLAVAADEVRQRLEAARATGNAAWRAVAQDSADEGVLRMSGPAGAGEHITMGHDAVVLGHVAVPLTRERGRP